MKKQVTKQLYYFTSPDKTNYHKLAGLKQQKLILSQCRRPEVLNQIVKSIGFLLETPRKNLLPLS